jgi:hypothetical protein
MVKKTLPIILRNKTKVYIAIDGPRNETDANRIKEVKNLIKDLIKQAPETKVIYRINATNKGCGSAVSSAIDWFFESESHGIIIEDDILVCGEFFRYIDWAIREFKNDQTIGLVSGYYNKMETETEEPELIMHYQPNIWGWATWKDRWNLYKFKIEDINPKEINKSISSRKINTRNKILVKEMLNNLQSRKIDTWDYQLYICYLVNNLNSITINKNLVINLDIKGGTHGNNKILKDVSKIRLTNLTWIFSPQILKLTNGELFDKAKQLCYESFLEKQVFNIDWKGSLARYFCVYFNRFRDK